MGWSYCNSHTRKTDVVRFIKSLAKFSRSCVVGNVFWGILDGHIICVLLNKEEGTWGHKTMDESMGPFYYSCPLKYLDLCPPMNEEWRAKVRRYHQPLAVGQKVSLNGCVIKNAVLTSVKPLRGTSDDGVNYRLKREYLA